MVFTCVLKFQFIPNHLGIKFTEDGDPTGSDPISSTSRWSHSDLKFKPCLKESTLVNYLDLFC